MARTVLPGPSLNGVEGAAVTGMLAALVAALEGKRRTATTRWLARASRVDLATLTAHPAVSVAERVAAGTFGFRARRHPYRTAARDGFVWIEPDRAGPPAFQLAGDDLLVADPTGTCWASRTAHVALTGTGETAG